MTRFRILVVFAVLLALVLWSFAPDAAAQGKGRGWTVVQGGVSADYPQPDWKADFNPQSATMTNARNHVSVTYFGTFQVTERRK